MASFTEDKSDSIALTEATNVVYGANRSATDTLALTEGINRRLEAVTDSIALDEIAFNDTAPGVTDTVTLSDSATASLPSRDTVSLAETVSQAWSGERPGSDTIALHESVSYILHQVCPTCCDDDQAYTLTVGSHASGNPTPPSTTPPTLTPADHITLSYPFTSPTLTLELRRPVFGNRDRIAQQRISRESRGGTLIIYADPQWPKTHTLVWEFSVLNEATAQSYLDFLAASLGDNIRLTDHEGRDWQGIIIQPDEPITRNKRCDVSASLTFEGELV